INVSCGAKWYPAWSCRGTSFLCDREERACNRYCWVFHFDGEAIDQVRAYLDSSKLKKPSLRLPSRSGFPFLRGRARSWGIALDTIFRCAQEIRHRDRGRDA